MYRSRVQLVVQRLLRSGNFRMKGMLGGRAGGGGPGAASSSGECHAEA
jgi:hypothetical protein